MTGPKTPKALGPSRRLLGRKCFVQRVEGRKWGAGQGQNWREDTLPPLRQDPCLVPPAAGCAGSCLLLPVVRGTAQGDAPCTPGLMGLEGSSDVSQTLQGTPWKKSPDLGSCDGGFLGCQIGQAGKVTPHRRNAPEGMPGAQGSL